MDNPPHMLYYTSGQPLPAMAPSTWSPNTHLCRPKGHSDWLDSQTHPIDVAHLGQHGRHQSDGFGYQANQNGLLAYRDVYWGTRLMVPWLAMVVDRKSVVEGKGVDLGGRRIIK